MTVPFKLRRQAAILFFAFAFALCAGTNNVELKPMSASHAHTNRLARLANSTFRNRIFTLPLFYASDYAMVGAKGSCILFFAAA